MENKDKKYRKTCLKAAPFILEHIAKPKSALTSLKAVGRLIDDSEIFSDGERRILIEKVCRFQSEEWGTDIVEIAVSIVGILTESSNPNPNTDASDDPSETSKKEKLKQLKQLLKALQR